MLFIQISHIIVILVNLEKRSLENLLAVCLSTLRRPTFGHLLKSHVAALVMYNVIGLIPKPKNKRLNNSNNDLDLNSRSCLQYQAIAG